MNTNIDKYIVNLEENIYDIISHTFKEDGIDQIVKRDLYESHVLENRSAKFQEFYFSTIKNENLYLTSVDFYRQFKKQYSLQGIDNNYLDNLEVNKREILNLIISDRLSELYFSFFHKAKVKYRADYKEKSLGSFFAKLVHTFRPDEYCALDNPIKEYFKLSKESFYVSFFIISHAYKKWGVNNNKIIGTIKNELRFLDKKEVIKQDKLTDLKLLDLIFWSRANR
jgi:hypothetical protein